MIKELVRRNSLRKESLDTLQEQSLVQQNSQQSLCGQAQGEDTRQPLPNSKDYVHAADPRNVYFHTLCGLAASGYVLDVSTSACVLYICLAYSCVSACWCLHVCVGVHVCFCRAHVLHIPKVLRCL